MLFLFYFLAIFFFYVKEDEGINALKIPLHVPRKEIVFNLFIKARSVKENNSYIPCQCIKSQLFANIIIIGPQGSYTFNQHT